MAARPGTQEFHGTACHRQDPGQDRTHAQTQQGVAELSGVMGIIWIVYLVKGMIHE